MPPSSQYSEANANYYLRDLLVRILDEMIEFARFVRDCERFCSEYKLHSTEWPCFPFKQLVGTDAFYAIAWCLREVSVAFEQGEVLPFFLEDELNLVVATANWHYGHAIAELERIEGTFDHPRLANDLAYLWEHANAELGRLDGLDSYLSEFRVSSSPSLERRPLEPGQSDRFQKIRHLDFETRRLLTHSSRAVADFVNCLSAVGSHNTKWLDDARHHVLVSRALNATVSSVQEIITIVNGEPSSKAHFEELISAYGSFSRQVWVNVADSGRQEGQSATDLEYLEPFFSNLENELSVLRGCL